MSSFIVDDKTINSIVSFMFADKDSQRTIEALSAKGIATRPQDLGEEMYKLNLAAVEDRYGDYAAGQMCDLDYRYRKMSAGSKVQVLKNLRCWLYQCSEGEIPETPLYQLMETYSGKLALNIVRTLPEYDTANWG
jgi:hypothetical protein